MSLLCHAEHFNSRHVGHGVQAGLQLSICMQREGVGVHRCTMKTLNTKSNLVLKFYYNYQMSVEYTVPCHCLIEAHALTINLLIYNRKTIHSRCVCIWAVRV